MARLLINNEREIVAPGYKLARVHKVEFAQSGPNSKVPGTPMLKLQLKVTEGPDEGKTLFPNFMLAGNGSWRTGRDLPAIRPDVDWGDFDYPEAATGTTSEGNDNAEQIALIREYLEDEDVIATVVHKPDDRRSGEFRAEVSALLPKDADVQLDEEVA